MRNIRKDSSLSWERRLIIFTISCLVLLVVSQVLMLKETPRRYLSRVDRLEGDSVLLEQQNYVENKVLEDVDFPAVSWLELLRPHKIMTVRMIQPTAADDVYVTINGKPAGDFRHGEVRVTVYDGDYVEIDARLLQEMGRFVVNVPKNEVYSPDDGRLIEGKLDLIPIGKVRFKE
ncbi:MAG: hypothetical protein H6Q73_1112 [Firmicutes bacterium]|nr:hypothetical protein [Bacillota bacterium]